MYSQFREHDEGELCYNWKLQVLHYLAKAMGVLIRIDGVPYGSNRLWKERNKDVKFTEVCSNTVSKV